jgi:DAACS family dicarboxylate/amino acid:cation (Na+ or H+) symporter
MSEQENKPNEELAPDSFEQELRTDLDDATVDKPKGLALHTKVLIGLLVGVVGGVGCHELFGDNPNLGWFIDNFTNPIGQLFLSLLLMIVVPLVFSSLIVGVAGIGDIRKLGRIGLKSFAYCLIISAISVVIGLGLANTIQPGKRISQETATKMKDQFGGAAKTQLDSQKKSEEVAKQDTALMSVVKTVVPKNIFYSLGSGENPNMLHVMFFALIIGIAITLLPAERTQNFVGVMESLFQISSKLIDIIMKLAPYAVACLIFTNMARFGIELLFALGWFVAAVLIGLSLHMFGVYSLSVYFLSKLNPIDFFRRVRTVILTAFSTSSSNATLPTALRVSEENLGVPREINSFVLTVGATANQNGTALYEGITVLFLAQLAGVELSLGAQLMVVYLAILGGIGTAGVPSGSIPFIIGILAMIGVDPALIAIILGVDRLLDMCRTTLNVVGDITAATYVARSEGYELLKTHPAEAS